METESRIFFSEHNGIIRAAEKKDPEEIVYEDLGRPEDVLGRLNSLRWRVRLVFGAGLIIGGFAFGDGVFRMFEGAVLSNTLTSVSGLVEGVSGIVAAMTFIHLIHENEYRVQSVVESWKNFGHRFTDNRTSL